MWYKNIASRFFGLVTKHACDGRTDRITIPKTALSIARAVKIAKNEPSGHHRITLSDDIFATNA